MNDHGWLCPTCNRRDTDSGVYDEQEINRLNGLLTASHIIVDTLLVKIRELESERKRLVENFRQAEESRQTNAALYERALRERDSMACDISDFLKVAAEIGYSSTAEDAFRQVAQALVVDVDNFKQQLKT
jgi:hypothetical protein